LALAKDIKLEHSPSVYKNKDAISALKTEKEADKIISNKIESKTKKPDIPSKLKKSL
jgi:hypothetical protein